MIIRIEGSFIKCVSTIPMICKFSTRMQEPTIPFVCTVWLQLQPLYMSILQIQKCNVSSISTIISIINISIDDSWQVITSTLMIVCIASSVFTLCCFLVMRPLIVLQPFLPRAIVVRRSFLSCKVMFNIYSLFKSIFEVVFFMLNVIQFNKNYFQYSCCIIRVIVTHHSRYVSNVYIFQFQAVLDQFQNSGT